MSTGAAKATRMPASHPKRTIALAPKTNESETPPLLGPASGTGKWLARVDAARSAATPTSLDVLCGSVANEKTAASTQPSPSRHTGPTMGARRCVIAQLPRYLSRLPLPVEASDVAVACDERDDD